MSSLEKYLAHGGLKRFALFFFFFCGYGNQHGKILTSNDFMRKEIPMAEWVACASAMGRSWITSCCILVLLIIYEASYIQYWGCIG